MARKYKDYISIDKDFIPVFSKNWDKKYPDRWKSFYPHNTFKDILNDLASSLEMGSNESRKSLWISGPYGTGKTFASFAIKHILEDDIEDVKTYFEKQEISPALLNRFAGLKQKSGILVVHRSSSSGIIGDNKLFSAIQESIKQALDEKGYTYKGGKSLRDTILDTLTDPNSSFNFAGAFNKYKEKFTEYASPEGVIRDLRELDIEGSLDLLQRIMEVADREGFNWSRTPEDIIAWIEDIIKGNNLYAIVFIWDEFSDYFQNNQKSITGFQELAQASGTIPFYFLLITHKVHASYLPDPDIKKKIEARFKLKNIEMADTTAFMLMKNALKKTEDLADEWNYISRDLWVKVEKVVSKTIGKYAADVKYDELKALLPLHPYAAYMLKEISASISSNQRTMFQFLSGDSGQDEQVKHNFRWYIENHSINDWYYLTCDYIWDYFFNFDNVDLDEGTRNVIAHYNTFENQCENEDEKRVLKTVLLLCAMNQKGMGTRVRSSINIMRPTLLNISSAFEGTVLQDKIRIIMDKFVRKGILGSMPEGQDTLYVTQSRTIDEERYKQIKEDILNNTRFEKLVSDQNYNIADRFKLSGFASTRFEVICSTHMDVRRKLESIKDLPLYKVPLVFLFAKTEEDSVKNNLVINKILKEYERDIIIADMSSQPLGEQGFNNFIELKAKASYFSKIDPNQTRLYDNNAKSVIEEWKSKLDITTVMLYSKHEVPIPLQGSANFRARIKELNAKLYTCGLETLTENDRIFSESGFKETVAVMGMDKATITSNYSYLNAIKTNLSQANIWNNHDYVKTNSSHAVSQMKIAVEELITEGFAKNSSVRIADIWNMLQKKPFGLMSCTGSVFILGFLLKEYADNKFYKKDGINTVPLTHDGLADMIFSIVKGLTKAENLSIVKMTPEHEIFCKYTGEIFKIPTDKQNSIQDIAHGIKTYLPIANFPLWSLKPYIEETDTLGLKDKVLPIIDLLCEFVSTEKKEGRDETRIAEEVARLYQSDAGIKEYLRNVMTSDNLKTGMEYYVAQQKPELIQLARKLGIVDKAYISELKKKLSFDASWLWNKGDIDKKIEEVYEDYKLIDKINRILTRKVSSLQEAAFGIRDKISAIKMPYEFFKDSCTNLNTLFLLLIGVYKSNSIKDENKRALASELEQKSDEFNMFFNNQYELFRKRINEVLNIEISDDECSYLYSKMDSNTIEGAVEQYVQTLKQHYAHYQKNKKYNLLVEKWKQLTGTETPSKWSDNFRVPVLCMFSDELNDARAAFGIINRAQMSASEEQINSAISFLTSSKNMYKLNDISLCNRIFKEFISGEYDLIINDNDMEEIKSILLRKLGSNVYEWYVRKGEIDNIVKEYASDKYRKSYYSVVFQKIDSLSPEKAKDYLKELIKNEPLVGIRIMKN